MADHLPTSVQEQFHALGETLREFAVMRDFPWSHVLRLTGLDGRVVWVKRCGDGMAFEPGLTRIVEEVGSPLLVPTLWIDGRWIATDHVDGQLQRDAAPMLDAMLRLQEPLADLQRGLSSRVEDASAVGTPSLGANDVEALVERALELCARDAHLAERPLQLSETQVVRESVLRLRELMARLDSVSDIRTIQHLDLHHGNVFEPAGGVQVFDWGDARIGSPLLHLVSTLSLLSFVVGVDVRDPRVAAVGDAYVGAWPGLKLAPAEWELVLDPRLAALIRLDALTAAVHGGSDEQLAPFADWLGDLVRAAASSDPSGARGVRLA
ncbi:MAG: hypothetical protein JWM25_72 [Thermoleophilia bacterium]|nr:hypothetical protein [Thermoleophilia bacterium]